MIHRPRIRRRREADILYRARLLAEGGTQALFEQLHPAVRWEAGGRLTVRIARRAGQARRPRAAADAVGLYLAVARRDDRFTWQPTLVYPARGIATVWEPTPPPVPQALGRVLGRTRSQLLATLETPHTGTALAQTLGVTPGAVSQHVKAMRAAGLIATYRDGRHVICQRTPLGEQLMSVNASD